MGKQPVLTCKLDLSLLLSLIPQVFEDKLHNSQQSFVNKDPYQEEVEVYIDDTVPHLNNPLLNNGH